MKCRICGSRKVAVIYDGIIRDGGLGKYTKENIPMYQCDECKVIWHDVVDADVAAYYESTQYRDSMEGTSEIEEFYRLHDKESLAKFTYTGTMRFRNKNVADIGCGGGAFLDYISGVAKEIIAIEPSAKYREAMAQKGYHTYAYAPDAAEAWSKKIDVITNFDVIEHVENPLQFIKDIQVLLADGGEAIIGTPTDAPIMRQLLGEIYEKKQLFSTQHLWIFAEENMRLMAKQAGFEQIEIKYFQRYGFNNFIGWLREERPCGSPPYSFVTETMNEFWKAEISSKGMSDYIVMYLKNK